MALIVAANAEIAALQTAMNARLDRHPCAAIVRSQPGLAKVLSARVLAEFGDDPDRYASAKGRKNYAGTSPITRQSGKKKNVQAQFVHNDRPMEVLDSPGPRLVQWCGRAGRDLGTPAPRGIHVLAQ